jgi:rubrerythrin
MIMAGWSLSDIAWNEFDAGKVHAELVPLMKAACMVEHNGHDYARYLREVFAAAPDIQSVMDQWANEEVQHGQALRKWAELADPEFDFDKSFTTFTTGYKLPENVSVSVRGSHAGELLARCVVEAGTSSYYSAIREYADEPVLKDICAKIAADEFRHYKLFYSLLNKYLEKDKLGLMERLQVALKRVAESEDDELAYAFFAVCNNGNPASYERTRYATLHLSYAYRVYRRMHIERMIAMIFKAVGLKPHSFLNQCTAGLAWHIMRFKRFLADRTAREMPLFAAAPGH